MKDTSPDMEQLQRELIMRLTPGERMLMAMDMYQTAKTIVEAGIRARHGDLPPREMRRRVFLQFYGNDLPPEQIEEILKQI